MAVSFYVPAPVLCARRPTAQETQALAAEQAELAQWSAHLPAGAAPLDRFVISSFMIPGISAVCDFGCSFVFPRLFSGLTGPVVASVIALLLCENHASCFLST